MDCTRKEFVAMLMAGSALTVAGCAPQGDGKQNSQAEEPATEESSDQSKVEEKEPDVDLAKFKKLAINMDAWRYDAEHDIYYQLGIPYCLSPAAEAYESLAIFVPGAYLIPKDRSKEDPEKSSKDKPRGDDKPRSCTINERTKVGEYTARTAPILMPINSGNLSGQMCPTYYGPTGLDSYLSEGCIYVYAGFRGRTSGFESTGGGVYPGGDPWPLVDVKAAVRFLRYNADVLPGNTDRIFAFGFSLGGGLSTLLGASGDSKLFDPYLEEIGAATYNAEGEDLSDAISGSASWCPVTSFDTADASYEWMMGQYSDEGTRAEGTWTRLLSRDLATAYGEYVNEVGFKNGEGDTLLLDETSGEIFADGSYYSHLIDLVQQSASTFFESTTFPYTYTPQHVLNASFPGDPSSQTAGAGTADVDKATGDASAQAAGAAGESTTPEGTVQVQSMVYGTQEDYLNSLNADTWWLTINERRSTVRITSLGDFVRHLKKAAKGVCAFDDMSRSSVENQLFGVEDASSLHFSRMVSDALGKRKDAYAKAKGFDAAFVRDWTEDLAKIDSLGSDMRTRVNMFNPLYYLSEAYEGNATSTVAAHWRINSGLFQTDTSLCTEANLALALGQVKNVSDVAFTPVWGQGHVLAEVSGTAEKNLVEWVKGCCKETK